jgi:uncharacterized protein (TIGR00106 family)
MSVLLELAMFPTDKGESVSSYVARVIAVIDRRNPDYRLTPMGTIVETADIDEALKVVADAYRELEPDCNRVYATIKLDIRKGEGGRISRKLESVEKKMGKKPKT